MARLWFGGFLGTGQIKEDAISTAGPIQTQGSSDGDDRMELESGGAPLGAVRELERRQKDEQRDHESERSAGRSVFA